MNEITQGKGMVKVPEGRTFVAGIKGTLEEGYHKKVQVFVSHMPILPSWADASRT